MPLNKDLREFIECLNSNKVEYLVVGAFAVSWHGFPRYSGDIDFLVRSSEQNAERVVRAIAQFGMASLGILVSDLNVPGKVVQMGFEPNRIDLLTSITAVTFDEAWASEFPYFSLKSTSTCAETATGCPFSVAGVNFHLATASTAF